MALYALGEWIQESLHAWIPFCRIVLSYRLSVLSILLSWYLLALPCVPCYKATTQSGRQENKSSHSCQTLTERKSNMTRVASPGSALRRRLYLSLKEEEIMAKAGRGFPQVTLQSTDTEGQGKAGRVFTQVRLQSINTEAQETNAQDIQGKRKQSSQQEPQSISKIQQKK